MGCGASTEPPKDKGPAPGQTEAEETPTAGEDAVADLPNVGPPSSPAAVARAERVTANATTADMRPAGRNSVTPEMIKRRNEHHETSSMVKRASQTGSLPWFYDVVREATVDQASCYEPLVEAPFEKRKACTDFYQLLFSATKPMTEDLPIERMIEEVRSLDSSERERFLIEWAYQTNRVGNVLLMSSVAQSGLDLDLTIQNVTMALQSILRCTHCTFFVREDDDTPGGPRLFTTYPNRAQFTTVRFPMSGIVGRALTDGQSRVIDSPVTDDAFDKAVDLGLRGAVPSDAGAGPSGAERAALPSSMMVLPLLDDRGVAFGVILALDKLGDRAFDESDLVTAQTMLNTSRAHILFTLEHKAIVKSQEEAAMVLDTAKLFSSEIKVERLAHIVMSRAKELTHAERACLFLVEPEKRELVLFVLPRGEEFDEESVGEAQELDLRLPLTAGMVGHAASSGEVLNIPSAYEDERFSDDPDLVAIDAEIGGRTQSVLCVPIRSREGTTVGVVQMLNKKRAAHVRRLETQLAIGSKSRTSFAAAPTPTTPALEPQSPCSTHSNSDAARPRMRIPAMAAVHRSTLVGGLNVSNMSASQMAVATQRVSQRISRNFAEQGGGAELPSDLSDYITFTDDDVHVVEALGAQAAIALENSMLYRKSVEQQHFLEGVMHSLDSIVLTFDRAGLLKSVNQKQSESASSFLNIRWKGWVGRHYSEWLAERNKLLCDNMRSCYEHHTSVSVFDYEFKSAITSALVNVKMVPLKDYAGEASGVVVMLEEQGAQQRLTAALTRYMPPDRVAAYVEHDFDPKARHMTGKTQRVAIVHLNVRAPSTFGFSGASVFAAKGHDPVQSLKVMNEASMHIGKAILKEEGVVLRYTGTSVVGCFGVPYASPAGDDAVRACRAALRAYDKFVVLNKKRREAAQEELALSAAVVIGDVTTGTIGFEKLEEYTVMGPVVDVAKRLADAADEYGGTRLLITDLTLQEVSAHFVTREADVVRLPGVRTESVRVHMLNNLAKTQPTDEEARAMRIYQQAYSLYQAHDMTAAADKCAEAPHDHLCTMLARRIKSLLVEGSPGLAPDWDGSWVPHGLWHHTQPKSTAELPSVGLVMPTTEEPRSETLAQGAADEDAPSAD